jgi:hypothetical protein
MAVATFYPSASAVDGRTQRAVSSENFPTIHAGVGTAGYDPGDGGSYAVSAFLAVDFASTDSFSTLGVGWVSFDTSSLGAGATIISAVLSLYGNTKFDTGLGPSPLHVAGGALADPTQINASDHQNRGSTSFGSVDYASFNTSGYNDISLNASGLAHINKTGVTSFSLQLGWDIDGSFSGTWVVARQLFYRVEDEGAGGQTTGPKLEITYTPGGANFDSVLGVSEANIASVNTVAKANIATINTV